jgi:hypothetical protein
MDSVGGPRYIRRARLTDEPTRRLTTNKSRWQVDPFISSSLGRRQWVLAESIYQAPARSLATRRSGSHHNSAEAQSPFPRISPRVTGESPAASGCISSGRFEGLCWKWRPSSFSRSASASATRTHLIPAWSSVRKSGASSMACLRASIDEKLESRFQAVIGDQGEQ